MYDVIPYVLSIIFILLGIFMAIAPSKAVKKEFANSEEHIKRARRNGVIILVAGFVLLIVNLILN